MSDTVEATTSDYRHSILCQLENRNRKQTSRFLEVFKDYGELLDWITELKIKNERLRSESNANSSGVSDDAARLLKQENERLKQDLTDLLKRKDENAQQLIDTSNKLLATEKQCDSVKLELHKTKSQVEELEYANKKLQERLIELEKSNETVHDEYIAIQSMYTSLEEKYQKSQDENATLLHRWRDLKQQEVDQLNEANDKAMRKKAEDVQHEIEEATKSIPHVDDTGFTETEEASAAICFGATLPSRAKITFGAHDGEVCSLSYSPTGRYFATGGGDRRLKLWEISSAGRHDCKQVFNGCNQSVMCIDFDSEETSILATSNDHAVRIWTILDNRLRHTFAGHTGKVHCARFLSGMSRVVSGSHDRTIKIWDLRSRACTKTIFCGSICQDLVTCEGYGASIISGHFDKRLRLYDVRSDAPVHNILMPDKITSIHLSSEKWGLLVSCRDDTLRYLDLRTNSTVMEYTADNFKTALDYSRAVLSPDDVYCAAGSADGSVCIWNVLTGKLERVLQRGGHSNPVVCCSWSPSGQTIASGDKKDTVIIWSDM